MERNLPSRGAGVVAFGALVIFAAVLVGCDTSFAYVYPDRGHYGYRGYHGYRSPPADCGPRGGYGGGYHGGRYGGHRGSYRGDHHGGHGGRW
jgi:hypothetical protein